MGAHPLPDRDLIKELARTQEELDIVNEALEKLARRRRTQRTVSSFPFSLLERGMRVALTQLERMVAGAVRAIFPSRE